MKNVIAFLIFIIYTTLIFFTPNNYIYIAIPTIINIIAMIAIKVNIKNAIKNLGNLLPFILLTGITENLRRQTQERIDEGIIGITLKKEGKIEKYPRVGVGLDNKQIKATSVTSTLNDFVGNCNKITMSLANNSLMLFVIKKNVSVLQRLYSWLKEQNIDPIKGYVDVPMLLIDDEAGGCKLNCVSKE